MQEIRPGLRRWTAPHPDWKPEKDRPGGWGQMVGCVNYEPPGEDGSALVLIDPLLPPEGIPDRESLLEDLDRKVRSRGVPVAVLLGNNFHERSAQDLLDRYHERPGAATWAHEGARSRVRCSLTHTFHQATTLPGGVEAYPITGLEEAEVIYYLPPHRALVIADALIGTGAGRVQVAPVSWAAQTPEGEAGYRSRFRASLRELLELEIDMLIVSHGTPVLEAGHRALTLALEGAAWGE